MISVNIVVDAANTGPACRPFVRLLRDTVDFWHFAVAVANYSRIQLLSIRVSRLALGIVFTFSSSENRPLSALWVCAVSRHINITSLKFVSLVRQFGRYPSPTKPTTSITTKKTPRQRIKVNRCVCLHKCKQIRQFHIQIGGVND